MSGVVHVASQTVQVGSEIRQRCVWCGHSLIEVDLRFVAVEDADQDYPTWPGGSLVEVDGGLTCIFSSREEGTVPTNFCGAPDDASSLS